MEKLRKDDKENIEIKIEKSKLRLKYMYTEMKKKTTNFKD